MEANVGSSQRFAKPSGLSGPRRFNSCPFLHDDVAKLERQGAANPSCVGSIPTVVSIARVAHLVERLVPNQKVAGSIPVACSKCLGRRVAVL